MNFHYMFIIQGDKMMTNGQIIALIMALGKEQAIKYGCSGLTNVVSNAAGDGLIFTWADESKIEYKLTSKDIMRLSNFDKNNDGIIDMCETANFAKEANKSKDSDKLNGKQSDLYFQKDINNSDDITEGINNKFLKQSDRDEIGKIDGINKQVKINKDDINNIKTDLINKSDELVKMNPSDTSGYLEDKIDKSTIQIDNNRLVAKTLDGLSVTIADLNTLQGVKSNIQEQINSITKGIDYKGQFNTYEDLLAMEDPQSGWSAIVKEDETQENKQMFYIYNGSKWEVIYEISAESTMGRDFTIQPIDLSNEVSGVLSKSKIDSQIARKSEMDKKIDKVASAVDGNLAVLKSDGNIEDSGKTLNDVALKRDIHNHDNKDLLDKLSTSSDGKLLFDGKLIEGDPTNPIDLSDYYNKYEIDNIIGKESLNTISQTLIGAINEVKEESFQNGVNAKNKVVTALTSRGASVTTDNTFEELANVIKTLTLPPATLQTTKLNVNVGEKKIINYGRDLTDFKFATSMLKLKAGEDGIVKKICSYNNADDSNFEYDIDKTIFDGKMKPKNDFIIPLSETRALNTKDEYTYSIKKSNYKDIQGFESNDNSAIIVKAITPSYVIHGKGDIDIKDIQKLRKINLNMQGYKILLSFDSGNTWKSYYDNEWIDVDINNLDEVKLKSMDKSLLDILIDEQLEVVRNGSNTMKLAYYQEQDSIDDVIYTDELNLVIDIKGEDFIANQSDWNYRIYDDNMSIEYTFNTSGTFTINRI